MEGSRRATPDGDSGHQSRSATKMAGAFIAQRLRIEKLVHGPHAVAELWRTGRTAAHFDEPSVRGRQMNVANGRTGRNGPKRPGMFRQIGLPRSGTSNPDGDFFTAQPSRGRRLVLWAASASALAIAIMGIVAHSNRFDDDQALGIIEATSSAQHTTWSGHVVLPPSPPAPATAVGSADLAPPVSSLPSDHRAEAAPDSAAPQSITRGPDQGRHVATKNRRHSAPHVRAIERHASGIALPTSPTPQASSSDRVAGSSSVPARRPAISGAEPAPAVSSTSLDHRDAPSANTLGASSQNPASLQLIQGQPASAHGGGGLGAGSSGVGSSGAGSSGAGSSGAGTSGAGGHGAGSYGAGSSGAGSSGAGSSGAGSSGAGSSGAGSAGAGSSGAGSSGAGSSGAGGPGAGGHGTGSSGAGSSGAGSSGAGSSGAGSSGAGSSGAGSSGAGSSGAGSSGAGSSGAGSSGAGGHGAGSSGAGSSGAGSSGAGSSGAGSSGAGSSGAGSSGAGSSGAGSSGAGSSGAGSSGAGSSGAGGHGAGSSGAGSSGAGSSGAGSSGAGSSGAGSSGAGGHGAGSSGAGSSGAGGHGSGGSGGGGHGGGGSGSGGSR
jgi:hypothetical protein